MHILHCVSCISLRVLQEWDKWNKAMDKFWDSNCRDPWKCWSVGEFSCMLTTPSNQPQESYHKTILKSKIPGMFKGSTEHVIHHALPQLVKMDGLLLPSQMNFKVQYAFGYGAQYAGTCHVLLLLHRWNM